MRARRIAQEIRPGDYLVLGHRGPNSRVARGGWSARTLGEVVFAEVIAALHSGDKQVSTVTCTSMLTAVSGSTMPAGGLPPLIRCHLPKISTTAPAQQPYQSRPGSSHGTGSGRSTPAEADTWPSWVSPGQKRQRHRLLGGAAVGSSKIPSGGGTAGSPELSGPGSRTLRRHHADRRTPNSRAPVIKDAYDNQSRSRRDPLPVAAWHGPRIIRGFRAARVVV